MDSKWHTTELGDVQFWLEMVCFTQTPEIKQSQVHGDPAHPPTPPLSLPASFTSSLSSSLPFFLSV